MNEFLKKIAEILEVENVRESDNLKGFAQWDSLAALSVIAMVDANYGITLQATVLAAGTVGDLWRRVQLEKANEPNVTLEQ